MAKYNRYVRYIEWLLSLIAMGYLLYRLAIYDDYTSLSHGLHRMGIRSWSLLLVSGLLIPVQMGVEAVRWRYTIRGWKNISFRESFNHVLLGMVAGFITPYRAGDLPARLMAAGLNMSKDEFLSRWHLWLHDWHKWFPVIGTTILRYVVWGIQLWMVLTAVGIHLSWTQAIGSIFVYYVLISIMPALPAADVPIKGGWAVGIFGQFSDNVAAILVAVSIIWIFNTIIPVLFGSLKKILYFCRQERDKTASL